MDSDKLHDRQITAEKGFAGICRVCKRQLKNPKYVAAGIGPVCARKAGVSLGSAAAATHGTKSDWRHERVEGVIVIYDLNLGGMSVTNDMEAVLKACGAQPGDKIIYQDSEGVFDRVELKASGAVGFLPIREKSLDAALAKVAA